MIKENDNIMRQVSNLIGTIGTMRHKDDWFGLEPPRILDFIRNRFSIVGADECNLNTHDSYNMIHWLWDKRGIFFRLEEYYDGQESGELTCGYLMRPQQRHTLFCKGVEDETPKVVHPGKTGVMRRLTHMFKQADACGLSSLDREKVEDFMQTYSYEAPSFYKLLPAVFQKDPAVINHCLEAIYQYYDHWEQATWDCWGDKGNLHGWSVGSAAYFLEQGLPKQAAEIGMDQVFSSEEIRELGIRFLFESEYIDEIEGAVEQYEQPYTWEQNPDYLNDILDGRVPQWGSIMIPRTVDYENPVYRYWKHIVENPPPPGIEERIPPPAMPVSK